jgi:DNA-binding MarR family transcriptional regulator
MDDHKFTPSGAIAFLLAQLGSHAAQRFAERLAPLSLKPPDAGILRMLNESAGMSQQDLAFRLGMHATRLVSVVDELERRGLVERREKPEDRRAYALHLTEKGKAAQAEIRRISREHNEAICATLSRDERQQLGALLLRIAEEQGLKAGIHPGYRQPRPRPSRT